VKTANRKSHTIGWLAWRTAIRQLAADQAQLLADIHVHQLLIMMKIPQVIE